MSVLTRFVCAAAPAAAAVALTMGDTREAAACGGCFHPVAEQGSSVVTDHRMVFKISKTETVLWDQVRYAGDPAEFAWVLPVNAGARIELSRDEWIAALDGVTQTTVTGPEVFCNGGGSTSSGGGGGGCGSTTTLTSTDSRSGGGVASDGGYSGNSSVQVVGQTVIGPYQAVTIRSLDGGGIAEWLTANGFAIPTAVAPVIGAYTRERFDFIALRLRPGAGVRAMQPVRIVTPGADATLPLRMVAAGVGARVGLTLWVIGEGRWHAGNFPDAPIDYEKLVWDGVAGRSNLADMQRDALAANGGRVWLTENAARNRRVSVSNPNLSNPGLEVLYKSACIQSGPRVVACDESELPPSDGQPDGGAPNDAGDDGGDAGAEAGSEADAAPPPKPCTKTVYACDGFDDFDVAARGIAASDMWITRMRADLPVSALDTDLILTAAERQVEDPPAKHTEKFSDESFDPCNGRGRSNAPSDDGGGCLCVVRPVERENAGTFFVIAVTALGAIVVARRKR